MKRKVLFRGKRIDNGEWIYGFIWQKLDPQQKEDVFTEKVFMQSGVNIDTWHEVDPNTVGQFVGIEDKNSTYMFEGDIINVHQFLFDGSEIEKDWIAQIVWIEDFNISGFGLKVLSGDFALSHTGYETYAEMPPFSFSTIYGLHEESFDILRNIHDN